MRKINEMTIAMTLCLVSIGSILLSASPSLAQSNDKETLVQDIRAYRARCEPAQASTSAQSPTCSNEKAELLGRQKKLNLTDADLDTLLSVTSRGGLR